MVFEWSTFGWKTFQITTLGSYGLYTVEVIEPSTGCTYMSHVCIYATSVDMEDLIDKEIDIMSNPSKGQLMFDFGRFQKNY